MTNQYTTFGEFLKKCWEHDLTYSFSDDSHSWRRGEESLKHLKALAKQFPPDQVKHMWNAMCDCKISSKGEPHIFYWKE